MNDIGYILAQYFLDRLNEYYDAPYTVIKYIDYHRAENTSNEIYFTRKLGFDNRFTEYEVQAIWDTDNLSRNWFYKELAILYQQTKKKRIHIDGLDYIVQVFPRYEDIEIESEASGAVVERIPARVCITRTNYR